MTEHKTLAELLKIASAHSESIAAETNCHHERVTVLGFMNSVSNVAETITMHKKLEAEKS